VVDNLDRAIWFANAFTGAIWQQGDANYGGVVDGRDRDAVLANLGLSQLAGASASIAATAVPEPGTVALLAAALFGLLVYARRRQRV
jgi:hypothetical protein